MSCGGGCSVLGALIVSPGGTSPVYTKPMRRGGAAAVVSLNVTEFNSSVANLDVTIEHKNSTGSWVSAGAITGISGTGVDSQYISSIRELVRLKFSFEVAASLGDLARVEAINWTWFTY